MTSKAPKAPPDPDPTPMASVSTSEEVKGAARMARKSAARNYGRSQSILTPAQAPAGKPTILGG